MPRIAVEGDVRHPDLLAVVVEQDCAIRVHGPRAAVRDAIAVRVLGVHQQLAGLLEVIVSAIAVGVLVVEERVAVARHVALGIKLLTTELVGVAAGRIRVEQRERVGTVCE